MSLQHHDNGKQGEFFLLDEQGKKIAKLTYFYETPDTINANHTFVVVSSRTRCGRQTLSSLNSFYPG